MRWNKYRLKTREDAEEIVIAALTEAGVEGVEIEDKIPLSDRDKAQMFVDIMPDAPDDDGIAYLTFYLDEDVDNAPLLARVHEELENLKQFTDIGETTIEKSQTEDKDWINNWKQYFHHFYVDDILITPSWEPVADEDKGRLIIHIDPGTAFGTGLHETTQLVIRQLRKYVTGETRLLDVGTGSGILSIAALKMGAAHAVGTDLDPNAISACHENLASNDIPEEKMEVILGNIIDDPKVQDAAGYERYDLVTANILAPVLVELTPEIGRHMKSGAVYITSGIIEDREKDVTDAVEKAGMKLLGVTRQGEWVCVTAQKV